MRPAPNEPVPSTANTRRPGAVLISEAKHARVTLTIGDRGPLEHHTAAAHLDDRERVRVAVRVNADHVVQLICKHP